jgi:hypothetical protein
VSVEYKELPAIHASLIRSGGGFSLNGKTMTGDVYLPRSATAICFCSFRN